MKKTECKTCGKKLSDSGIYTGLCAFCAERRHKSISKALFVCTVVGVILACAFYAIVYYIQLKSDGTYYGFEIGYRVYMFFVEMDLQKLSIICIFLFLLPLLETYTNLIIPY